MQANKLIILVAPTGNQVERDGIMLPTTPDEIAEESRLCHEAGASVIHIHARDPKTKAASGDLKLFGEIVARIKERSDILVQTTTSLGLKRDAKTGEMVWHSAEERLGLLSIEPSQDLLSCPLGSWEFIHPEGGQPNPTTMVNSFVFLRENIAHIVRKGIPWEMEIAEVGFLHNAARLAEEGVLDPNAGNFWLDYIMGFGGMPATARQLVFMAEEGKRLFPKAKWEVNATGPDQFRMDILGASMGCDIVRVGFEDNVRLPNGRTARRNHELVEAMADLARSLGREIATVAEARAMLGAVPHEATAGRQRRA